MKKRITKTTHFVIRFLLWQITITISSIFVILFPEYLKEDYISLYFCILFFAVSIFRLHGINNINKGRLIHLRQPFISWLSSCHFVLLFILLLCASSQR